MHLAQTVPNQSCVSQDTMVDVFHVCSKSISVFNRCVPADVVCYAEFAQGLVTFISDNNVFRRVIAGVMASKEIIMGLCLLALGRTHTFICCTLVSCVLICTFVCKGIYVFRRKILLVFTCGGNCTCQHTPVNFEEEQELIALVVSCCPLTADIYSP